MSPKSSLSPGLTALTSLTLRLESSLVHAGMVTTVVPSEATFLISSRERWSKCSWLIRRMSALSGIRRTLKGSMITVLPFLILKESWPSQLILTPWYSHNLRPALKSQLHDNESFHGD